MKSVASLTLGILLLTDAVVHAQATKIVIDPTPGGSPCTGDVLTKNIGFFTSTTLPAIIVGRGEFTCTGQGGMFLSYSTGSINGPWQVSTIEPSGDHYERAIPFTYKGDTYPGIITSEGSGQVTKWFYNPLNWSGNPTQPWPSEVIANAPCHDMHVADIDGDGKLDVVCSSTAERGDSGGYIAYQNNYNDWSVVYDSIPLVSEGIAVVRISNIWDIAVSNGGTTYLYINPRAYGQNPRTTTWQAYNIGPGTKGTSLEGGMLGGRPVIYECSNETEYAGPWSYGCVMFQPVGTSYTSPWKLTEIDSTYRDVHEINAAIYPQGAPTYNSRGIPNLPTWLNGLIVGEQEQASATCNSQGLNDHRNISGCRVTYFRYNGNGTFTPIALSTRGTQNQSIIAYNGGYAVAGANHDVYGAVDRALNMWLLDASGGSGGLLMPGSYLISSGTGYVIDGGFFTQYWGYPPAAEAYPENGSNGIGTNPDQQFNFSAAGTDYTICDDYSGACLTDGSKGLLDIGQGTDTWVVGRSGSGWTIKNNRTGNYMGAIPDISRGNVPMSSSAVAIPLLTPGSPTSTLMSGNYHVGSLYSANYWVIDGGFFTSYWGLPPAAEAYPENGDPISSNPAQQFNFAAAGSRFTICDVANGACLTDGGGVVEIGQGTDTWAVAQDGAGWSIQDMRTGRYMGVIPDVSRGDVPMASSAVAISLK